MRARLILTAGIAAAAVVGSVFAASPASAQGVTFTLTGGVISIAETSTAAALTPAAGLAGQTGTTVAGALGSTTVTDNRAGVLGWQSKITGTTAFSNGTFTIPVTAATAFVPGTVSTSGVVAATQGTYLSAATGLALTGSAQTLVTATAVVGNNTATFNPSLSIAVPGGATAGDYVGAVTQTVS
ncbi:MAG: hypothetical protein QOJ79_1408 [Actinomycetota bacterium]|jgi:hypothetical protein|nr:hypothetical protein [Actinomycetota bacterium]